MDKPINLPRFCHVCGKMYLAPWALRRHIKNSICRLGRKGNLPIAERSRRWPTS